MPAKRYCQIVVASIAAVLVLIALLNLLVDPYRVFPALDSAQFHRFRDTIFSHLARAELARRGDWDMAILGTSRPKAGMPADHPAFATNHVVNLAVDAVRMSEVAAIFDYTRKNNPLRRVLLCLDLALCRPPGAVAGDFDDSRFNPATPLLPYYCRTLFGSAATDLSFKFLIRRLTGQFPAAGERDGFHVRGLPPGAQQRAVFQRTLRSLAGGHAGLRVTEAEMESFRNVLAACRENNIELTLAINPTHALDLELLHVAGAWERFEDWKRSIVAAVAQERMEGRVAVWDFSGYSGPTVEEVPAAGDTDSRMKFYFENSHYTPALGALMLDRMYCRSENGFGSRIDRGNIEARLKLVRDERDTYVRSHPSDVQWVQSLGRKVLTARRFATAEVE